MQIWRLALISSLSTLDTGTMGKRVQIYFSNSLGESDRTASARYYLTAQGIGMAQSLCTCISGAVGQIDCPTASKLDERAN